MALLYLFSTWGSWGTARLSLWWPIKKNVYNSTFTLSLIALIFVAFFWERIFSTTICFNNLLNAHLLQNLILLLPGMSATDEKKQSSLLFSGQHKLFLVCSLNTITAHDMRGTCRSWRIATTFGSEIWFSLFRARNLLLSKFCLYMRYNLHLFQVWLLLFLF